MTALEIIRTLFAFYGVLCLADRIELWLDRRAEKAKAKTSWLK